MKTQAMNVSGLPVRRRIGLISAGIATAATALLLEQPTASAVGPEVRVSITNNSPTDGVYITPVWVGFHDGSFDSYNGGLSSQPGLESIAEDGNPAQISADFGNGLTYIDNSGGGAVSATVASGQDGSERQQATIGGGPIGPGGTVVSDRFSLNDSINRYFSYASMVLPSSDYFLANGDPLAHDLQPLYGAPFGTTISFDIGVSVNDAGTEINDFDTSAGNGLFPGLPAGQSGPNEGADEGGVVTNVAAPFANFLNRPVDFDTNFAALNFADAGLYPSGIATVNITVVPEPSAAIVALGLACLGAVQLRRRRS